MSVAPGSDSRGSFGVVGRPDIGEKQRRNLVEEGKLTEKVRDGLEADDFIIYGKASVEKYDEDHPPQKLEMSAFSDKMDSFFENGIISRRHKDIPIGEPLREHTLDESTEVVVGDEVLEFDAGDTLSTGIEDDELWIVARLHNDTELARDTRVGAMSDDLNGFSVTVFCKEWEETPKGQRVTDLDWHSVTIGADEQIKNPDSRFGVAEFKMFDFVGDLPGISNKAAERAATEILRELPSDMPDNTNEKGFWDRVSEIASQKSNEAETEAEAETDQKEDVEDVDADQKEDVEDVDADQKEDTEDVEDVKGGDVDHVLEKVRNEIGEEDAKVLEKEMDSPPEPPEPPEGDEDGQDDREGSELKADPEAVAKALSEEGFVTEEAVEEKLDERLPASFVTEDTLEEKLAEEIGEKLDDRLPDEVATKQEVQDVVETAEEVITDTLPEAQKAAAEDAAEETAEKMVTGETPDPSGGSDADEQDYMSEIQQQFGSASN